MAQPSWIKKYLRMKPEVTKIFEDLEEYRGFCVSRGHVYNEADLYIDRSPYGELARSKKGKWPRNNWGQLIKQMRKA